MSLLSINCSFGGDDELQGGTGEVDYIVGGSRNDNITGGGGMDLVFGDHAFITLYADESHKLKYATTTDADCAGGVDTIILGGGDDLVRFLFSWMLLCLFHHVTHRLVIDS